MALWVAGSHGTNVQILRWVSNTKAYGTTVPNLAKRLGGPSAQQSVLHRQRSRFSTIRGTQLDNDLADVVPDGEGTAMKAFGDLIVAQSLCQ